MFLRVLAATGLIFSAFSAPVLAAENPAAPRLFNGEAPQPAEEPKEEATAPARQPTIPSLIPPPPAGMKTIQSSRPARDPALKAQEDEIKKVSEIEEKQRVERVKAEIRKNGDDRLDEIKKAFEEADKLEAQAAKNAPAAKPAAVNVITPPAAPAYVSAQETPPVAPVNDTPPKKVIFSPPKKETPAKPPRLFNVR